MSLISGYELSRAWFEFCFSNPEKIKPAHGAIYFFAIEHCNRLGWKEKFGFPTGVCMEVVGVKSFNTYMKCFNDLVEWGFFKVYEKSKNQYTANIIALSNFNKAHDKALDKALIKQGESASESIGESIDSIDKQLTINNKQENYIKEIEINSSWIELNDALQLLQNSDSWKEGIRMLLSKRGNKVSASEIDKYLNAFFDERRPTNDRRDSLKQYQTYFQNWILSKFKDGAGIETIKKIKPPYHKAANV